jgi:hypothetical protein
MLSTEFAVKRKFLRIDIFLLAFIGKKKEIESVKRELSRIFGPRTRGWRKFHNEEIHHFCCSTNIISMMQKGRVK